MKKSNAKLAAAKPAPVFPIAVRKRGENSQVAAASPKSPKRENTFSQSRDTREDRGTRQMKNTRDAQTFAHVR